MKKKYLFISTNGTSECKTFIESYTLEFAKKIAQKMCNKNNQTLIEVKEWIG